MLKSPILLFRLYEYCMREVKCGNFEVTLKILKELCETWIQARENIQAEIPQPSNL